MNGWNNSKGKMSMSRSFTAAVDLGRRGSCDVISRLRTGSGGTHYFSRSRKDATTVPPEVFSNDLSIPVVPKFTLHNECMEANGVQTLPEESQLLQTECSTESNKTKKNTTYILPMNIPLKRLDETDSKVWQQHGNNHLGLVLSALYAKLLVVCGTGFSLAEVISSYIPASFYDGFYLYLYFVSILFMTCILGNVIRSKARRHARNFAHGVNSIRARRNTQLQIRARTTKGNAEDVEKNPSSCSSENASDSVPSSPRGASPEETMKQRIAEFDIILEKKSKKDKGTHFGSFYLRMGAVAFGVGSMIYSGLEFGQYFELKPENEKCHSYMIALTPTVRMIFTFMQMYFIFLNSKMAVSKVSLAKQFGLMHMIGTNLCVWLNVLVQETKHEILNFYNPDNKTISFRYEKAHKAYLNIPDDSTSNDLASTNDPMHEFYSSTNPDLDDEIHGRFRRGLKGPHSMYECGRNNIMGSIVQDAAPFLFPCTIEYSLICAAICYVMWKSMAKRRTARIHRMSQINSPLASPYATMTSRSPHHYTVDCNRANKGLFVGIFFLVLTIMSIIVNLVLDNKEDYKDFANTELSITEIVLYTSAIIAVMMGMCQMRVLRYAKQRNLELDNILLIVSQTGSLIFNVFTIISGQFKGEKLVLMTALTKVIQLLMQTLFILDASNRAAATLEQARRKPGREVVTFLLVTNLAMWLINALEKSRGESHPSQLQFYGVWGWTIITHISMPLAIFYRFHSTVCLCEIWKKAFKLKRN